MKGVGGDCLGPNGKSRRGERQVGYVTRAEERSWCKDRDCGLGLAFAQTSPGIVVCVPMKTWAPWGKERRRAGQWCNYKSNVQLRAKRLGREGFQGPGIDRSFGRKRAVKAKRMSWAGPEPRGCCCEMLFAQGSGAADVWTCMERIERASGATVATKARFEKLDGFRGSIQAYGLSQRQEPLQDTAGALTKGKRLCEAGLVDG
jgi:hypothetical protein